MGKNLTEKKLTPKQAKAIESLMLTGSVTQAARAASVSRPTIYDWLKQPAFVAELQRLEGLALQGLARQLSALTEPAIQALSDGLQVGMPISARLRAAAVIIERAPVLLELSSLVARVESLERRREER